ncbi:MAG: DUF2723 domain-containing protein, partial [Acidobacteriota bacterium]
MAASTESPAGHRTGGSDRLWLVVLVVLHAFVLLATLLPHDPATGDSAKFQFLGRLPGTPHATGYPAFLLLSALADRLLPFGPPSLRVDLLTAALATLAVACTYRAARSLGARPAAAFAGAGTLAFTHLLWTQATVAEVYTLHLALVAAASWAVAAAANAPTERLRQQRATAAGALGLLGFANHLTIVCLGPALAAALLRLDPRGFLRLRTLAVWATAAAAAAASYALVVRRTFALDSVHLEMQARDLPQLLDGLLGGPHRGFLFQQPASEILLDRLPAIAMGLAAELSWALPIALAGLPFAPWLRSQRAGKSRGILDLFLVLLLVGNLVFVSLYSVPDLQVYSLPLLFTLALCLARGAEWLLQTVATRAPAAARWATVAVALLPAVPLLTNLPLLENAERRTRAAAIDRATVRAEAAAGDRNGVLLLSLDYEATGGFLVRSLLAGTASPRLHVLHVPPVALRTRVALAEVKRYARGGGDLRLGGHGLPIPPGLPIVAFAPNETLRRALRDDGWRLRPVGDGVVRLALSRRPTEAPALPTAFWVGEVATVATVGDAVAAMSAADFDPRREAIAVDWRGVEVGDASAQAPDGTVPALVRVERSEARRLE